MPKRAWLTLRLLAALLACLTAAGAQVSEQAPPQPKNATGCTRIDNTSYQDGFCTQGDSGCYYCEHTDRYGTYGCTEAPNPADGINCYPIYNQIP